jgi:hypothetical protein
MAQKETAPAWGEAEAVLPGLYAGGGPGMIGECPALPNVPPMIGGPLWNRE